MCKNCAECRDNFPNNEVASKFLFGKNKIKQTYEKVYWQKPITERY